MATKTKLTLIEEQRRQIAEEVWLDLEDVADEIAFQSLRRLDWEMPDDSQGRFDTSLTLN